MRIRVNGSLLFTERYTMGGEFGQTFDRVFGTANCGVRTNRQFTDIITVRDSFFKNFLRNRQAYNNQPRSNNSVLFVR